MARFYSEQLSTQSSNGNDILARFEKLMHHYYDDNLHLTRGLPSVKYCAQELCLSPNYFSDLMRQITGENATTAIRRFVMKRAKDLLMGTRELYSSARRIMSPETVSWCLMLLRSI